MHAATFYNAEKCAATWMKKKKYYELCALQMLVGSGWNELPCGSRLKFNERQSIMKIRTTNNREIHLTFPCACACACARETGTANRPSLVVIYFPICCTEGFNTHLSRLLCSALSLCVYYMRMTKICMAVCCRNHITCIDMAFTLPLSMYTWVQSTQSSIHSSILFPRGNFSAINSPIEFTNVSDGIMDYNINQISR